MSRKSPKVIANVRVGKPDVEPTAPSHVRGVFEGNRPHPTQRGKGLEAEWPDRATGTARRSTGIRPKDHEVIDPRMPKISPA
ncbi:MAG TPA: hypothetical protein VM734_22505 [Kofleriaceae bacterium]|nr:hypothetical protein [Kofleriaceae bacterium]